jgi:hypothetical protein
LSGQTDGIFLISASLSKVCQIYKSSVELNGGAKALCDGARWGKSSNLKGETSCLPRPSRIILYVMAIRNWVTINTMDRWMCTRCRFNALHVVAAQKQGKHEVVSSAESKWKKTENHDRGT